MSSEIQSDWTQAQRRSRQSWVMVFAASMMLGMAFGTLICVSVFLKPLGEEFGWERGVTSLAYSSSTFFNGVIGIFVGRLVDRYSIRPLVLTGAVIIGLSQLLLSRIESIWQLYLIYGLMVGGFGGGTLLVPLMTTIGFWFERNKGMAMAVVMAGQSLGGAIMPMLIRWLISETGWRNSYLVLGLFAWAILIPMALLMRDPPGLASARASARSAKSVRSVLRPKALTATLSVAIVCCCICMSIPLIHVYPLVLELGFAPAAAAGVLGVIMSTSIVGRLGIARVGDRVGGMRALLIASALQTAMVFWFSQASSLQWFYVIGTVFGLGYGGVIPSYAIIVREMIPVHRVGVAMGVVFFFGNVGMATGGYLGGVIYDWSGGYPASYATGALAGVSNLLIVGGLMLFLRTRRAKIPAPAP